MKKMDIFNIGKRLAVSEEDMRLLEVPLARRVRSEDRSIFTRLGTPPTTETSEITTGTTSVSSFSVDESKITKKQPNFADDYVQSFMPFTPFAYFLGRFPFTYKKDPRTGIYTFHQTRKLIIIYSMTSIFIVSLSSIYYANLFSYLVDSPKLIGGGVSSNDSMAGRAEENFIFYRNLPILFVYGMSLLHLNVTSLQTLIQGKFIASYMGFCANSLNLLKLPACKGLPLQMFYIAFVFALLLVGSALVSIFRYSPISVGGPGLLGMLFCRIIEPRTFIDYPSIYEGLQIWMSIIFTYMLITSKVYPMIFIVQTKTLRSLFHLWNQRLEVVLNRKPTKLSIENSERTSFKELYDDHNLMIQLLRGADVVFQESMDSFFFSSVFTICSLSYFLWRSVTGEEYNGSRKQDLLMSVGMLVLNGMFVGLTMLSLMQMSQEALEGFDAVRRRNLMGNKSEEELYFLFSLYISYSGYTPMTITGSGYCIYDNNFVFSILGNIAVLFVIMYQISVPISLPATHESYRYVLDQEDLLERMEGRGTPGIDG